MSVTITPNTRSYPGHTLGEFRNGNFAFIKVDGSVVTGSSISPGVARQLNGNIDVTQIFSAHGAFAALRVDGSVVTWGDYGGDSSAVAAKLNGDIAVIQVFSTGYIENLGMEGDLILDAFAALRVDGSVVTWGDGRFGGDSSAVATQLNGDIDVTRIFSNTGAFAALRADGSVVTWGKAEYGGDSAVYHDDGHYQYVKDYSVAAQLNGDIDVSQISSTNQAFAALRADGSVVTWGKAGYGGDSAVYHYVAYDQHVKDYSVAAQLNGDIDVTRIFSNTAAFAALRADGSVLTWGTAEYGGDSAVYHNDDGYYQYVKDYSVAAQLNGDIDVAQIFSTDNAFAALRIDGSVVTWGEAEYGGDSAVHHSFYDVSGHQHQYVKDYSVAAQLNGDIDVAQIFSTDDAFAALRTDGSVVTWGNKYTGGDSAVYDYSLYQFVKNYSVEKQLNGDIDVTQIFSNNGAFAALRADGSVVTWGRVKYGGDSSSVAAQLNGDIDVTQIFSTSAAFAALRADGSVVVWGSNNFTGNNGALADLLGSEVVSGANIDTHDVYLAPPNLILTGTSRADALLGGDNDDVIKGLGRNDLLQGNAGNDKLIGGPGDDVLIGGSGDDRLQGEAGNDILTGGRGQDVFSFGRNALGGSDDITDFSVADDTIKLDSRVFTSLTAAGPLDADLLLAGPYLNQAQDNNDYLIYNVSDGVLYYDADASGAGAAVAIAVLGVDSRGNHPVLTAADFSVA